MMTTLTLLETLARRWYLVVVGLILTVAMMWHIEERPGVYWTQVDVTFLTPKSAAFPNSIEQTTSGVTATAGLVAYELNHGNSALATRSSSTTLAGQGVRDGYQITLPNSGGQWAYNFERPVLDVQVIGPDESAVRSRLAQQIGRIDARLAQLQQERNVRPSDYITTLSAPSKAQVFYLRGYPARALAVVLILGLALTAVATTTLDRWLRRRAPLRMPVVGVRITGRT